MNLERKLKKIKKWIEENKKVRILMRKEGRI